MPVWHSGLTRKQSMEIERMQKLALRIILQENYPDYKYACSVFATETLEDQAKLASSLQLKIYRVKITCLQKDKIELQ